MITKELEKLAQTIDLDSEDNFELRVKFGIACIQRVKGLLTDDQIIEALAIGERYIQEGGGRSELYNAAASATQIAQSHAGSGSLDGSGNAAVSVSRGVAAALHGRALEASGYASYASVYSYSASAVTDISAYAPEQQWQIDKLRELSNDMRRRRS